MIEKLRDTDIIPLRDNDEESLPELDVIFKMAKDHVFATSKQWKEKFEKCGCKKPRFEVLVFPDCWHHVRAYTTIVKETVTGMCAVFIDNKPCYLVTEANINFIFDCNRKHMANLETARKRY